MNNKSKLICETVGQLMEMSVSAKERNGTDIFISWSPHCDVLGVIVYFNGWEKDKTHETFDLYLKGTQKNMQNQINSLFSKIIACLEKGNTREAEIDRLKAEVNMLNQKAREPRRKIKRLTAQTGGQS